MSVARTAWLIARKDLRIEWKSRVITNQVVPFAGVTMVIFGFALDANTDVLELEKLSEHAGEGLIEFYVLTLTKYVLD